MVKVLHLGLVAILSAVVAVSFARPLHHQRQRYDLILPANHPLARSGTAEAAVVGTAPIPSFSTSIDEFEDDGSVRSERSTNISHIAGSARKIQMYVRNRHLQILADGTVNGTSDDGSDYTILQRISVNHGQVKIQGVATCFFLCMDSCGLLYGSKEYTEDCIFNEMIEQHHYNTYSSARYSDNHRKLYLALDKRGRSRKVQIRGDAPLGKKSELTRVLPQTVEASRVDDLVARILRSRAPSVSPQHALRHHGFLHLCPQPQLQKDQGQDEAGRDKARCRGRKKRGKKKRKCRKGEEEGEQCQKRSSPAGGNNKHNGESKTGERGKGLMKNKQKNTCNEAEDEAECKKRLQAAKRKRKPKEGDKKVIDDSEDKKKKKQKRPKSSKKKKKFVSVGEISKDLDSGRRRNKSKVSKTEKQQNQRDLVKDSDVKVEKGDNVTMTSVSANTSSTVTSSSITTTKTTTTITTTTTSTTAKATTKITTLIDKDTTLPIVPTTATRTSSSTPHMPN